MRNLGIDHFLFIRIKKEILILILSFRRIISNNRFEDFQPARKFSYVKGVVKDFPCVQKAQQLLRSCLHGYRLRPDAVDCTGTSIAHWAAQREHPLPLFKTLKELGSPLTKNNKVNIAWPHRFKGVMGIREHTQYIGYQIGGHVSLKT